VEAADVERAVYLHLTDLWEWADNAERSIDCFEAARAAAAAP
jgi:hypothetical protein